MIVEKKKKRVSKKNKAAWRKHSDIRDVEDFLEDQRLEERLGRFDTKKDEEIFMLDTVGEGKEEEKPDVKPLSAKEQKRAKLNETPRCFQILLPSSKVEDPNKKRNTVKATGSKPSDLSKLTTNRKIQKGVLQKQIELTKKNIRTAREKKRKAKTIRQTFDKNLWSTSDLEAKGIPASLCEEFISPEAQLHNVHTTQRFRAKPPLPKTVVSRVAVEPPHPGVSYNPSFQEHQDLLQQVVQHEEKMMKKEAHLLRVTNKMFRKITPQSKHNQWIEEMSVGLPQPHKPQTDEHSDSDGEYRAINPPVQNKKKDHKARRRQREMIEEKERRKREKIDKKKITDLYKLRKLQASITKKEKRLEEEKKKKECKKKELEETALPALNAHKTPKREPDFVPPEELSGDLRTLSASKNLLRERFESLQRRGVLAASRVMMKKKRRVKSYFKAGHKVTDQDVEKYMNNIDKKNKITVSK
ncbi:ribosome biogenesis protein NOP53 [Colias croceus]|uniref:ribosome biogenesis protein NOP53 n=1 Tax=Colias crocea TaxID=72248 RepID=UPI001E27ECE9|nr:ribosome biogenesis protein NOP53 [Colias croceus]